MIAATWPLSTDNVRPSRIFLPSISTCRFLTSRSAIVLTHASFQTDRNKFLRLDRKFHRQLLQHVLDEAVDDKRGCLLRRHAALAAVEEHVFGNLRGRRLVFEGRGRVLRLDVRHGMVDEMVASYIRIALCVVASD